MRSAWICVLAVAWSACAASAPVSDVDEATLGLGSDEQDEDSPPTAAKLVVTCFDARAGISVAVEQRKRGEPGDDSCDPEAPPHGGGRPSDLPVPDAPRPPLLVVVEREAGAVACGCGFGPVESARGVPALPPDAPVPGSPPTPPVPASGTNIVQSPAAHTAAHGGVPGPTQPAGPQPAGPSVTITISSGAPGEPAKIVPPPSCDELTEQCYADGLDTELCEELAACCANTPVPSAPPAPN